MASEEGSSKNSTTAASWVFQVHTPKKVSWKDSHAGMEPMLNEVQNVYLGGGQQANLSEILKPRKKRKKKRKKSKKKTSSQQ